MKISSGTVTLTLVNPAIDDFQPIPVVDTSQILEPYHVEGGGTRYTPHGYEEGMVTPQIVLIDQGTDALAQAMLQDLRRMIADKAAQPLTVQWDDYHPGGIYDGPWFIEKVAAAEASGEFPGRIEVTLSMAPAIPLTSLPGVGAAGPAGHQQNGLIVGAETWIDFEDSPGITWTVTDDPGNNRVQVSATAPDVFPSGSIHMFGGATAPAGYLLCNGAAVSRTTYAALFAVIGTDYGAGDGTSTFNLPDLRGRVPLGVGTGTGLTARSRAATGGAETHVLSVAEMPAHHHDVGVNVNAVNVAGGAPPDIGTLGGSWNTNDTGGGAGHTSMQPWIGLNFVVKT